MVVWQPQAGIYIRARTLCESLPVDFASRQVIAAVGAGGKTSALHGLARELSAMGKKVLLTTSTHMAMPDRAESLTEDPIVIRQRLAADHFALVGRPAGHGKMEGVPAHAYLAICSLADIVLVEADGSRQMPLKLPARHEPVIPDNTTHVLVLAGLGAIGQTVQAACHRPELVRQLLKVGADHCLTPADLATIIGQGYWQPFVAAENRTGTVILNQADDADRFASAVQIAAMLAPVPCLITQLQKEPQPKEP